MDKKSKKDKVIDQDATNPNAKKRLVKRSVNLKKADIDVVEIKNEGDSILEPKELVFDSQTMANVELVFVGSDVVQEITAFKEETTKPLPEIIRLEEHDVLTKPENNKSDKSTFVLIIVLCVFWYIIGIATTLLVNL